jgi:hypothetical protein
MGHFLEYTTSSDDDDDDDDDALLANNEVLHLHICAAK